MEQPSVTVLKSAGREEQMERWGIAPQRIGALSPRQRLGAASDDPVEAFGGCYTAEGDEPDDGPDLQGGGWIPVDTARGHQPLGGAFGARDAGMSAHRGVLHPDEYVDTEALRAAVEAELGFTYDDVHGVYRRGRLSPSTIELRARIDARFLELASAGANTAQLGRVLGFHVNASGSCEALNNALERARKEHE